ncbi:MAG: universal stress protein [Mobilitalea sp.]
MKLLVPVDNSTISMNVVKQAIIIAKAENLSMKLIAFISQHDSRVYTRNENLWRQVDGSIITGRSIKMTNDESIEIIQENAMRFLDTLVADFDFNNIPVEKEVLVGAPYDKILETVEKEKPDLIVMSNRKFYRLRNFLFGSVADKLIHKAACPVLVVNANS